MDPEGDMNQIHRLNLSQAGRADGLHRPVEEAVAGVVRGGEQLQVPPEEGVLAHLPPLPAHAAHHLQVREAEVAEDLLTNLLGQIHNVETSTVTVIYSLHGHSLGLSERSKVKGWLKSSS